MRFLATLLFILLSPGVLLTIPPVANKIFMSRQTSLIAVFVHAVLFFLILKFRDRLPFVNRIEGFSDTPEPGSPGGTCIGPQQRCGGSLSCDGGTCRQLGVKEDAACDANKVCASGLSCQNGTCQKPPGTPGGSCLADGTCLKGSGLTCVDNKCKTLNISKGQGCNDHRLCASDLTCITGSCKRSNLPLGDLCSLNDICSSGLLCDSNKCKSQSSLAGPCDAFNACPPPLVCNRGVCMNPQ